MGCKHKLAALFLYPHNPYQNIQYNLSAFIMLEKSSGLTKLLTALELCLVSISIVILSDANNLFSIINNQFIPSGQAKTGK